MVLGCSYWLLGFVIAFELCWLIILCDCCMVAGLMFHCLLIVWAVVYELAVYGYLRGFGVWFVFGLFSLLGLVVSALVCLVWFGCFGLRVGGYWVRRGL